MFFTETSDRFMIALFLTQKKTITHVIITNYS